MGAGQEARGAAIAVGAGTLLTIAWWARGTPLLLDLVRHGAVRPMALPLVAAALLVLAVGALRLWRGGRATVTLVLHAVLALLAVWALQPSPPAVFIGPLALGVVVACAGAGWSLLSGKLRAAP